jgi:hypothetical protein
MPKRNVSDSGAGRKRRKAEGSYAAINFDASNRRKSKVEEVRVWNVTASDTNGRVSATRKNHQLVYESPLEPPDEECPSDEESIPIPADPEPSELPPAKAVAKSRRVQVAKENDSVSFPLVL